MEQIDQHCFVTLSQTQSGAILYDQRDLSRAQRRFSFGPSSIRVSFNFIIKSLETQKDIKGMNKNQKYLFSAVVQSVTMLPIYHMVMRLVW